MGYCSIHLKNYGAPLTIIIVLWGTFHFPTFSKCAPPGYYTLKMSTPYEQMLRDVTTLCKRRQRGDIIKTLNIMNGIDDVDPSMLFKKIRDCHGKTRRAVSISSDGSVVENMNLVKQQS